MLLLLAEWIGVQGGHAPPPVQYVVERGQVDSLASELRGLTELALEASQDLRCYVC